MENKNGIKNFLLEKEKRNNQKIRKEVGIIAGVIFSSAM